MTREKETVLPLLEAILKAAAERGWTQAELARRAGLGPTTLSKAKAAGDLRLSTLERLAAQVGLRLTLVPNRPQLEKLLGRGLFDSDDEVS